MVPGSFPSQLAAEPSYEVGQRRFIVMDDNVHAVYGVRVEQVRMLMLFVSFQSRLTHNNAIIVSCGTQTAQCLPPQCCVLLRTG